MPPPVADPARRLSATDAAFAGFRLARARPQVVLALAAVNFALLVVFALAMVTLAGPDLARMQALGPHPNPDQALALLGRLTPFYTLAVVLVLATYAVVYAAVCRALLRPSAGWSGAVRLGRDELRQGLVLLSVALLLFAVYVLLLIVGVIAAGLVGAAVPTLRAAPGVLAIAVGLVVAGALLFAGVRLSLASPLAFDEGRVDLKGAWRLTRGRFWPLFGAYLLAWFVMLVLAVVMLVAYAALGLAAGGSAGLNGVFQADISSLAGYFTPMTLLYMAASSLLYGLGFAVLVGAAVDAYRQIAGRGDAAGAPSAVSDRSTHFGLHV